MMKQDWILQELVICLEEKWQIQLEKLKRKMSCEGMVCREYAAVVAESSVVEKTTIENSVTMDRPVQDRTILDRMKQSVLLTDCSKKAMEWKRRGGVCIGCVCSENSGGFFDGADLVIECLDDLDIDIIEETLLHGLGLPVTIAETQRLIIREIIRDDVDKLYRISQQPGMEYLMRDQNGENCFEPERMLSYIENVYRFYGYGLWSVWTKTGELIGCCGLSELHTGLELQYMVASEYQRQGYGMEMCTAALNYAFDRTEWEEVWVRIHPDNQESSRLAQRLGFLPKDNESEELCLFALKREKWGICGAV